MATAGFALRRASDKAPFVTRSAYSALRCSSSLTRPAALDTLNVHRSNAQELIARVPVIEVQSTVAMCDGGGGATGHPIEFIKLDKRGGPSPNTCKYCGLRYQMAAGHHGH